MADFWLYRESKNCFRITITQWISFTFSFSGLLHSKHSANVRNKQKKNYLLFYLLLSLMKECHTRSRSTDIGHHLNCYQDIRMEQMFGSILFVFIYLFVCLTSVKPVTALIWYRKEIKRNFSNRLILFNFWEI